MRECGIPRQCVPRVVSCVCVFSVEVWGGLIGYGAIPWLNLMMNIIMPVSVIQSMRHMVNDIYYILLFKINWGIFCLFVCLLFKSAFTTTAMHCGYMTDMLVSRYFHRATDIPPLQSAPCICIQKRVVTSLESELILIRFLSMRRQ